MSVQNILVEGRIAPAVLPIWSGTVTLVAGESNVVIPNLPENVIIMTQYVSTGGGINALGASLVADAGTPTANFTIKSADNTDVSEVKWLVMSLP